MDEIMFALEGKMADFFFFLRFSKRQGRQGWVDHWAEGKNLGKATSQGTTESECPSLKP